MSFEISKSEGLRILSLDGGDLSCISQLRVLEEFMRRVEHDSGSAKPIRPCDYFQSITGVGASGAVAILLGVLGLSIEDTSAAFIQLCEAVSLSDHMEPKMRSNKLISASTLVLQKHGVAETAKLRDNLGLGQVCKVSIPYVSAVDVSHCRMLQSYNTRHFSLSPTIIEAICISWAIPGLFSPVSVGGGLIQEELLSASDGFNNPTLQAVKEARDAFGGDQKVSCVLSLGAGRSSSSSLGVDGRELTTIIARDTENVAEQLKNRYSGLHIYFRISVDRSLDFGAASEQIERRAGMINSCTSSFLETHDVSETLDRCVRSSRQASQVNLESLYRTRASGSRSSHGLPPLSAFFVTRKKPLSDIAMALRTRPPGSPAIGIVIGLSGTGKTQACLKYAYDHDDEYDHILFVDASSAESLEKGLITRIKALDHYLSPADTEEALGILINCRGNLTRNWLLIMDNADDANLDIASFLPSCDHGSVLITSRNAALSDIHPDGHVALDVMTHEEAIDALLSAALGPESGLQSKGQDSLKLGHHKRTKKDYESAAKIVEELGCLPLAVIQAACYIRKQKCLHEYPNLLKSSRSRILRWPASVQRDKLKYAHSTYAAFDTTLNVLSPRTLQFLGVISFCHFSDFPKSLISLPASLQFEYQPFDLMHRPPEYRMSIDLLRQLFCPNGDWDPMELDGMLEELQNYSLVTLVPAFSVITLHFHPLLHGWANDRLSSSDRILFRGAAVRLLVCGANEDDQNLRLYLPPHVERLSLLSDELHVNDRAALAETLYGEAGKSLRIWEEVYTIVKDCYGERHERATRAALQLANAYGNVDDSGRMESMEKQVVAIRKEEMGEESLETVRAMGNLARTYRSYGARYQEAAELEVKVLQVLRKLVGPKHREIVQALRDLALTNILQGKTVKAQTLLVEALEMNKSLLGRANRITIHLMEQLAVCFTKNGNTKEAAELEKEVLDLWRALDGDNHASSLDAMAGLGVSYFRQGQYRNSEDVWWEVAAGRRDILGSKHHSTLSALFWLAKAIENQQRYNDAEIILNEVVKGWRSLLGDQKVDTLDALDWLAHTNYNQGWYSEAEQLWEEVIAGRRIVYGENDYRTLAVLFWQGKSLVNQGRYADAETIYNTLVVAKRKALGDRDYDTVYALFSLAQTIYAQKRYAESEILFKEVAAIRCDVLGPHHQDTVSTLGWIGSSLYMQNKYIEAEAFFLDEVAAKRSTLGEQHGDVYDGLHWLALCAYRQGRFSDCEKLWSEVVLGRREVLGANHEDTLQAEEWLEGVRLAIDKEIPDPTQGSEQDTKAPSKDLSTSHSDEGVAGFRLES